MKELIFNSSIPLKACLFVIAALIIGLIFAIKKIYSLSRKIEEILELSDCMRSELTERRVRIEKLTAEVAELKMRKVIDVEQIDDIDAETVDGTDKSLSDAGDAESADVCDNSRGDSVRKRDAILVVEDNADLREAAVNMLREVGYLVETAENGENAVGKFRDSEDGFYSLILMDLKMPTMNGTEAASLIRSSERKDAKSIPIIAMTANAYEDDLTAIVQSGMNAHISKPLEASEIAAVVEKYIVQGGQGTESTEKTEITKEKYSSRIVSLRVV